MRLAMVSRPLDESDLRLARQMGMTDVVTTVPGVTMAPEREQGPALQLQDLLELRRRVEATGMRLSVIEGYQLSDRITLGLPGRDDDIGHAHLPRQAQIGFVQRPGHHRKSHGSFSSWQLLPNQAAVTESMPADRNQDTERRIAGLSRTGSCATTPPPTGV